MARNKKFLKNSFHLLLLLLSIILIISIKWFKLTFSDVTLEQLIFHLKVPLNGSNDDFFMQYLYYFKTWIPFIVIVFFIVILFCSHWFNHSFQIKVNMVIQNESKNFLITVRDYVKILYILNIILFIISLIYCFIQLNIRQYISNIINVSTIYEDSYVDPKNVTLLFPKQKQNLIYIYLESMESTFQNLHEKETGEINLIPNLKSLALNNISFSNTEDLGGGYTTYGTTWTIAGMVAQTAGIPLTIPIDGNSLNSYSSFLPGVYNLGDILDREGYNQFMIIGSDKAFGGRSNYFEQHGKYQIYDYYSAIKDHRIPKDYYVWWGYEDLKLFDYAKEQLLNLSKKDQPFNFTLLTADTHAADGYRDDTCQEITNSKYANAVICSDQKVYDFIRWIQEQDFYDNTTIVISGDHLLMGNFLFDANDQENHTVYNAIINSRVQPENAKNRTFTTLDMFPTTLAAMGVDIEGDRLGLGTNLFSTKKTLAEELGYEKFNKELQKKSHFYNNQLLYEKKK